MHRNGSTDTDAARRGAPEDRPHPLGAVRARGGRRLFAPLVGLAFAAALVTGCGGSATEEPTDPPSVETTDEEADDGASDDGGDPPTDDSTGDDESDDATDGTGENLFEGTWNFGHDTKVLSAEELGDLLEEEAEARGPDEMSLDVECGDGVDTGAGDDEADCVAYADEGVEHPWKVTVGPADAGLVIEVENVG